MYEHVRNRIKTEVSLVVAQEAAKSSNMVNERDVILENIQGLKAQISGVANILKEIRTNEETFALHVNKQQELEGKQIVFCLLIRNKEKTNENFTIF